MSSKCYKYDSAMAMKINKVKLLTEMNASAQYLMTNLGIVAHFFAALTDNPHFLKKRYETYT